MICKIKKNGPFDKIARDLMQRKVRLTRHRRRVLEVFVKHAEPLTVDEVYSKINASGMDRSSVYRAVNVFCLQGTLTAVTLAPEGKRFELSDSYRPHHHHLVCRGCGRIEDFEECFADTVGKRIGRKMKFKVEAHDFKLIGLCSACHTER